jgi:hypothetical protein
LIAIIRTTLVHAALHFEFGNRKTVLARSVRQSATIPATLVPEVRPTAKEQRVTMSRALVALAERGVRAEVEEGNNASLPTIASSPKTI